ncbi:MAG: tautomerase family protein [Herpetosiphonaceae bacterium]|nr:tautomerase family protein [Herpetosiphonaceae bacterium]
MAQIKVYGLKEHLNQTKAQLSDIIHACAADALQLPTEKRFHRFFPLDRSDFYYPTDRTEKYTIIEISMFEGRSTEAKKHLVRLLFARISQEVAIGVQDIEITISETPKYNWGIRGLPGDELGLNYKVEV